MPFIEFLFYLLLDLFVWATPRRAQSLLQALWSGITSHGAWRPSGMLGIKSRLNPCKQVPYALYFAPAPQLLILNGELKVGFYKNNIEIV